MATFDFNTMALRETQPNLFLKIALSATKIMSLGHLGAAIWHRRTIICGVPPKINVTPTSQRQRTIFVRPLMKYSYTQSIMCLKIGPIITVNGNCYRVMLNEVLFTKFEEKDIGNSCFQQDGGTCHTAEAALSAAKLMSFGHLGAAIWHRWTIICGVPSKISVMPTSQRQLSLQRTIFMKPLVKYSCTQWMNVLKNWTDRVGYCTDSRGDHLN